MKESTPKPKRVRASSCDAKPDGDQAFDQIVGDGEYCQPGSRIPCTGEVIAQMGSVGNMIRHRIIIIGIVRINDSLIN